MPAIDRTLIAKLARSSKSGVINSADASNALGFDARKTAAKLGSLAKRGWLHRVRRGVYLIVPLEAEPGKPATAADPWILAQEVFSPCYIGGWSAAGYWELTEQIFRPTLVVTAAAIRSKSVEFRLSLLMPIKPSHNLLVRGLNPCGGTKNRNRKAEGKHLLRDCGRAWRVMLEMNQLSTSHR